LSVLKEGMIIPINIENIAFGGDGVGRYQNQAVFVPYTAPDDEVAVKVTEVRKRHARGIIREIIRPSPQRIAPRCPHFTQCGGCDYQHLSYPDQLAIKKAQVGEIFRRIGCFPDPPVAEVIPSPRPFNYRGKADFWVRQRNEHGSGAVGFLRRKSRDVVDVDHCEIIVESLNQALRGLREQLRKSPAAVMARQVTAWSWGSEIGADIPAAALDDPVLKEALLGQPLPPDLFRPPPEDGHSITKKSLRNHHFSEELFHANIHAQRRGQGSMEILPISPLTKGGGGDSQTNNGCSHSTIHPVFCPVHANDNGDLAFCGDVVPRIVMDKIFLVPANGFFQANLYLVEQLVDTVVAMCALTGRESVLDAYCGSGLFSMFLAPAARRIFGIELWERAATCARENLGRAGHENAVFFSGDMRRSMEREFINTRRPLDVLVIDPPRDGCKDIPFPGKTFKPQRIVYVSCHPATQARDCRYFADHGYTLQSLQPLDMFPQTSHIEVAALLVLGNK